MVRSGTHANPPVRLPGESHDEYLRFIRTCPIDYSTYVAPHGKGDTSYAASTRRTAPKPKRVKKVTTDPVLMSRACPECSINFSTVYITKIYCSDTCVGRHYSKRKRALQRERRALEKAS